MGTRSNDRTPDWLLERIVLGELPPDRLAAARARLAAEPDGTARLAAIEADNARTLAGQPPDAVAREVERRAASQVRIDAARATSRRRTAFTIFMPLAAATAALALYVRPGVSMDPAVHGETPDEIQIKGDDVPRLFVYRSAKGDPELLSDGAVTKAGDTLQLRYASVGRPYGVVLSIDGRGSVTLHHPAQVGGSTALVKEGTASIERAYQLDDAPRFETFYFYASPRPIDVPDLLDKAARAARDANGDDLHPVQHPDVNVTTVHLRKAP